jgi:hypothetical protein
MPLEFQWQRGRNQNGVGQGACGRERRRGVVPAEETLAGREAVSMIEVAVVALTWAPRKKAIAVRSISESTLGSIRPKIMSRMPKPIALKKGMAGWLGVSRE